MSKTRPANTAEGGNRNIRINGYSAIKAKASKVDQFGKTAKNPFEELIIDTNPAIEG